MWRYSNSHKTENGIIIEYSAGNYENKINYSGSITLETKEDKLLIHAEERAHSLETVIDAEFRKGHKEKYEIYQNNDSPKKDILLQRRKLILEYATNKMLEHLGLFLRANKELKKRTSPLSIQH